MTYTIIAHCAESGRIGVASTTVSLAVGGLCPFYSAAGDIVVSQAYANPATGLAGLRLVNEGREPGEVLERLGAQDPDFSYRQFAILMRDGRMACHSGADCRPYTGDARRGDLLAFGNVLAGRQVIETMLAAASEAADLAEALISALEAGRDAGGQADGEGRHLRERSAYLKVIGGDPADPAVAPIDLRVDIHAAAVAELRRQYEIFKPVAGYNRLRGGRPPETPAIAAWEADHLTEPAPPSPFAD